MDKLQTAAEVGGFLRARKKYWLAPIILVLLLLGILVVVGESTALGPFIYPFF